MDWRTIEILAELLVVVVVLIDMSGFVDEMKARLKRWLHIKGEVSLKPLDCSFCMYHWTALVVLLCLGRLNLTSYMAICIGCLLTGVVRTALAAILDGLQRLLVWRRRKV